MITQLIIPDEQLIAGETFQMVSLFIFYIYSYPVTYVKQHICRSMYQVLLIVLFQLCVAEVSCYRIK